MLDCFAAKDTTFLMTVYYIAGLERGAGATAFASSLALMFKEQGRKAGYFKPVAVVEGVEYSGDPDTSFCRAQLGLDDPVALAPRAEKAEALAGGLPAETRAAITQRWPKISSGKDAMFVEGLPCGGQMAAASADLATTLDARVVLVARYRRAMDIAQIVAAKERFGARFAGVVLNAVPPYSQRVAMEETRTALEAKGVRVLGLIPEDRVLVGFSVADYSKTLGGRILNNEERVGDIVENILVGALLLGETASYYERKPNMALVTRGDRPDLQWNALDASTRCVILTGGKEPIAYVREKAHNKDVPLVMVPMNTVEAAARIDQFVTRPSFYYPQKLARFRELLREHVNLATFAL